MNNIKLTPSWPTLQKLLTSKEVANLLSISERTVWALGVSGKLPRRKIGSTIRFDPRDVEEFIRKSKERT